MEYTAELSAFISRLKEENLFETLPLHTMIPYMPVAGKTYGQYKKIFFIGQDANHIKATHDSLVLPQEREEKIFTDHDERCAFDFSDENFLNWYFDYNYYFWEFPIRFVNLINGNGNSVPGIHPENIGDHPYMNNIYQSFAWSNLGPVVFPHIYEKIKKAFNTREYATDQMYWKAFAIAEQQLGNAGLYVKYFQPEIIVVLSKCFNESVFFNGQSFELVYFDDENYIKKYHLVHNNIITQVFVTYHPSYMMRLENKGGMGIADYVDEIYSLCDAK
ncbi:MAG: hypothetical protein NT040_10125 [Bacteroidetes bacterium]|nr:hypothetical protein [Bacteroidota bacterium]